MHLHLIILGVTVKVKFIAHSFNLITVHPTLGLVSSQTVAAVTSSIVVIVICATTILLAVLLIRFFKNKQCQTTTTKNDKANRTDHESFSNPAFEDSLKYEEKETQQITIKF